MVQHQKFALPQSPFHLLDANVRLASRHKEVGALTLVPLLLHLAAATLMPRLSKIDNPSSHAWLALITFTLQYVWYRQPRLRLRIVNAAHTPIARAISAVMPSWLGQFAGRSSTAPARSIDIPTGVFYVCYPNATRPRPIMDA